MSYGNKSRRRMGQLQMNKSSLDSQEVTKNSGTYIPVNNVEPMKVFQCKHNLTGVKLCSFHIKGAQTPNIVAKLSIWFIAQHKNCISGS